MGSDVNGNNEKALKGIDEAFSAIVAKLCDNVISNASHSVGSILELSTQFVDKKAQKALKDFRDMYFFNEKIAAETAAINDDVDGIIDDLRGKMERGEEVDFDESMTSKHGEMAQNRMAISGLQKQLEQIITLDENIKKRLLPVLSSMQFEDMIRQRIEHVRDGWVKIIKNLGSEEEVMKAKLEEIGASLSSGSERDIYFPRILGRPAPEEIADQQSIEDILF